MDSYQEFIALSRYARWLPDKGRRETWPETVHRYFEFFQNRFPTQLTDEVVDELSKAVESLNVMPSMRALMTAGEALTRDNVAGYNCSYAEAAGSGETLQILTEEMREKGFSSPITIHMSNTIAFDQIMYILLCGTGVGFSCERQVISTLPVVGHKLPTSIYARTDVNFPGVNSDDLSTYSRKYNTVYAADTKYGWASAFRILITELYNGNYKIKWDLSKVRPAGAPLKTFGGRASGPGPLDDLFNYSVGVFSNASGRKLTSVEVHGIVCKIAEVIVVGGVRRSALISLSNLSDDRMRHAKSGSWWVKNREYRLANNSVAYTEKPSAESFMREWLALVESKSGERGIFNRQASVNKVIQNGRRDPNHAFGTNPCSEIILRNKQFCNLSEVVVRSSDTYDDLVEKVKAATILGTLQATLTDFVYLSPDWAKNTREEALLGVSLTGIMDHPILSKNSDYILYPTPWKEFCGDEGAVLRDILVGLKQVAINTNLEWSKKLGINQSAAITCVKPSGTVSQLVNSASGIHPRYSPYYIRTVRIDKKDPLYKYMVDAGFPGEDDVTAPDSTYVFSFPQKSPENAIFRNDRTALEQLELWLTYQRHWCEHKPSITVYVKDDEWFDVGAWVFNNFNEVSGISFLPYDGGTYQQAPYQEIDKATYEEWLKKMPKARWNELSRYENTDMTAGVQELACAGGQCEI